MSILDPLQPTLNKALWNEDLTLRPVVREYILKKLYSIIPFPMVKKVNIIGSNTGYQYNSKSDVDINVFIDREFFNSLENPRSLANAISDMHLPGTLHPINFFFVPYIIKHKQSEDGFFGVYNVLGDSWDIPPEKPEDLPQLDRELWDDVMYSKALMKPLRYMMNALINDSIDLSKLSSCAPQFKAKQKEIENDIENIWRFYRTLENRRKLAYRMSIGVPRFSSENIIYKTIEHSMYGNLLKTIEDYVKSRGTRW